MLATYITSPFPYANFYHLHAHQILHASRFKLVDEIGPLVTWLHNGTWLDEVFLWRPHIRSSDEKTAHTWSEVRNAAMRVSLPTGLLSENHTCSIPYKNIFFTDVSDEAITLKDNESIQSENSTVSEYASHFGASAFDPDIPSINELHTKVKGSTSCMNDQLLDDISDSGDEDGIFT